MEWDDKWDDVTWGVVRCDTKSKKVEDACQRLCNAVCKSSLDESQLEEMANGFINIIQRENDKQRCNYLL